MNTQNILFLIIITALINCDEDLQIKIGLPEYICDKDGGIRDVSKDMTTIRLLGKDAQNVDYKFELNFRTIGAKCRNNQRCTLLLWKSVRQLEDYLKNYPLPQLRSGLIEINNTMFVPGIKYILNVTMISDGAVKEQQLTLDYVDDNVRKTLQKPMASLVLLAPDSSFAYHAFVVNAEVNICSNISSFYFKWELDDAGNFTGFSSRGSELVLEPDTFRGLQTYSISCALIDIGDDSVLATNQHSVSVLSKGLIAKLPLKRLTTSTNQPVQLKAFVKDLDNTEGDIKISWTCIDTRSQEPCDYDSDSTELSMDSGFTTPGVYEIGLDASKNAFSTGDSCLVEVKDGVPVVEIAEIEFPVNPSLGVEIRATIYGLVTFCTLQWTSGVEDGYEFLDMSLLPGNPGAAFNVTMKEDVFLNELEEFSNGTLDKKHDLIIPPVVDSWQGLKGDAKYLFRIIITCPPSSDDFNLTEPITSISEVVIETNAPPKVQQLEVTPLEGDAFLTTFVFKTPKAEDKIGDAPILYKFGFVLGNTDVIVWNLGDVNNCQTTLPYSVDGIQTFVEICDNYNSCARQLGPVIKTNLPQNIDPKVILERFTTKMNGGDYNKAFSDAFIILFSYKEKNIALDDVIMARISQEIDAFLNLENYNENVRRNIDQFIKTVNDYNTEIHLPEAILNQMLELRNRISDDSQMYRQRKLQSIRPKRSGAMTLYDVRTYMEISELIITTSSDPVKISLEKENLRKRLRSYMEKLCVSMKKPQLTLELKTVIFSVEKLKKNSLNNLMSIPFDGNSWQVMARINFKVKDPRLKCVGRAVFRDYLNMSGLTYFGEVLNGNEDVSDVAVYLPKNTSTEGKPNCLVYYDNSWRGDCKLIQNIANYVKCSCKQTGYYYLEYVQVTTSVLPTTTQTVPTTDEQNITHSNHTGSDNANTYDTISYVVITISVVGIIILIVAIRKVLHDEDDGDNDDETFEFPKYAQLHNEEYLNDAHI